MKKTVKKICFLSLFTLFLSVSSAGIASAGTFTVVIDAGHGGHDAGAIGKYSKEKNLNLSVSLLLGRMIEENHSDVKVIYTRKSDFFLTLQERADIVNKNSADVFFCVHTNANNNSSARGTETYTLRANGSRTDGNLEVAMRENSVMLLEDDYKTRYQGFNPQSVESYIMFDLMQDRYLDRSVQLADLIQREFVKLGRYNRGVQQAGFWVLYKSACPSVLVEMGFISNRNEETYLNSDKGQKEIASGLYRAFVQFKKDHDKKAGIIPNAKSNDSNSNKPAQTTPQTLPDNVKEDKNLPVTDTKDSIEGESSKTKTKKKNTIYKVQIFATKDKLKSNSAKFKGLKNTEYYVEKGLYKYTYGKCSTIQEANEIRKSITKKFPQAFVVEFNDGKRISIQ